MKFIIAALSLLLFSFAGITQTQETKTDTTMKEQFLKDVIEGMSKTPLKTLPSKYFYDKKGDELFVQIMAPDKHQLLPNLIQRLIHHISDLY